MTIDDDLYRRTRELAARRGCSVGSVIEEAIAALLTGQVPDTAEAPRLPSYRGGALRPGLDLSNTADLLEAVEEGFERSAVP